MTIQVLVATDAALISEALTPGRAGDDSALRMFHHVAGTGVQKYRSGIHF